MNTSTHLFNCKWQEEQLHIYINSSKELLDTRITSFKIYVS